MEAYLKCVNCLQIHTVTAWHMQDGSKRCPACWRENYSTPWPEPQVNELLVFVTTLKPEERTYGQVASVFLSAALDLMLEQLIATIAYMNRLPEEVDQLVDALLAGYQGRGRLFELYEKIGFGPFQREVKNIGCSRFLKHWDILYVTSSQATRGQFGPAQRLKSFVVGQTIEEGMEAFSQLHNIYSKQSICYRTAVEEKEKKEQEYWALKKWVENVQGRQVEGQPEEGEQVKNSKR